MLLESNISPPSPPPPSSSSSPPPSSSYKALQPMVLDCSTTFFQLSLFCTTFFQLRIFVFFTSSKMSSSQRVLSLPIGLLDMGFHLLILCTVLSVAMRSTWPNQFRKHFYLYFKSE